MPNYNEQSPDGLPALAQVAVDGSHVLIYASAPFYEPTYAHRTVNADGIPCWKISLTSQAHVDEAMALTALALEEFNRNS